MKRLTCLLAALLCSSATIYAADDFIALDRAGATRVVNAASHTKPTIVALWSSECIHCKKNLKLFADMARVHPQLKLITIAVEPMEEGLAEPLDRLGVSGSRFAYGAEAPEALAHALDPKWRGELPRTILFDGRGGKVAFSGIITETIARASLALSAD
ncbi:TlpA family protein disulfide reductase [Aromatoleum diolicum]|uniref:Thioredoxin domain-containing protein n=1 Tax=Aromatoleum diolicum TaxID=75796 RepID=A0ABX1QDG0_9RHOO|nr:hypothetical protein [Aromatoleum diolicum]NMG75537.1 hypothetical protein [Aromatoleum diolicum]